MKIKNTILATLCIMGLGGALALTPILNNKQNNNDVNNVIRQENKKYVSYNDNNYQITLTSDELDNYVFTNLATYFNNVDSPEVVNTLINNITANFDDEYVLTFNDLSNDDQLSYRVDVQEDVSYNLLLWLDEVDFGKFAFSDFEGVLITSGYTSIIINCTSSGFDDIKSLIELDIQANTATMGSSITGAITSGLGLVGSLATEFITGFSALLWNSTSNTLTSFGTFALVFLGIAITMAVIKLVLAIFRGNTGA